MERTIIVITGLPGSGKSEASGYIKSLGIPMFRTGDIVREEVLRRGLELNAQNSEMIARKLREEEGMDVLARRLGGKIKKLRGGLVCVEGPRDMHEVRYLATLGRVMIIITEAPEKTRFGRLSARKGSGRLEPRSRDPKTFEEFRWRDERELERGLREVMATDSYPRVVVSNAGAREELTGNIRKIVENLKKGSGA
jgi:dephospho-CoA kinase